MKQLKKIFLCLALSFLCLFSLARPTTAYALTNNTIYTNAMYDLQQDEDFDASAYPVDMEDYSLDVIQIAESSDNELFVYVYQPCSPNNDLLATSINISKSTGENLNYSNHGLTLLNSSGTLYKYRVNGLIVNNFETRYYNISSIFRKWYEEYDSNLPSYNENTISEVAFEVATEWVATTENGEVFYTATSTEVVTITDKYVGFVRFDGQVTPSIMSMLAVSGGVAGGARYNSGFDSHFVAFNTDKPIDKLLSAELIYTTQHYEHHLDTWAEGTFIGIKISESESSNTPELHNVSISFDSVGTGYDGRRVYSWNRIQTVEDFLSTEDKNFLYQGILINVVEEHRITAEGIEDLQNMQWLLRFSETEYVDSCTKLSLFTRSHEKERTGVADVSILRLEFEVDEVTYNLGVVDNKQTGDSVPDNETIRYVEPTELSIGIGGFFDNLWQGIVSVFKAIFNILKIAFWVIVIGGVVFLIVKLVISIIRRKKNKRADNRIKKTRTPIRRKKKGTTKNYRRKYAKKIFKKK